MGFIIENPATFEAVRIPGAIQWLEHKDWGDEQNHFHALILTKEYGLCSLCVQGDGDIENAVWYVEPLSDMGGDTPNDMTEYEGDFDE